MATIEEQEQALTEIFASLNCQDPGNADSYSPCIEQYPGFGPHGVEYDALGNVVALRISPHTRSRHPELGPKNLYGPIPASIGDLPYLELLEMGGNNFTGGLPRELGKLQNLKFLSLRTMTLTGPIPVEFTQMPELVIDITNSRPNRDMSKTFCHPPGTRYWATSGQIKGEYRPPACGRLISELEQLAIVRTIEEKLGAEKPTQVLSRDRFKPDIRGHITKLELETYGTEPMTLPGEIADLAYLQLLEIKAENITGTLADGMFHKLENLETLKIEGTTISGPIPVELTTMSSLERLWIKDSQLEGAIPPEMGNMTNLEDLNLADNNLEGPIPAELARLSNLKYLNLAGNQFTGPLPDSFKDMTELASINLERNSITAVPAEIWDLPQLASMELSGNQLQGSIESIVSSYAGLWRLGLANNQLTGTIPAQLGGATDLRALRLGGNQLTGAIPPELGNLGLLETLELQNNMLTGELPEELSQLASLQFLLLNGNNLTGEMQTSIVSSDRLRKLQFEDNDGLCITQSLLDLMQSVGRNLEGSGPTC